MRSRPVRRKRWPLGLAALLGFTLVGAIVAAVVNGRQIAGSVPGDAPILGLAATEDGYLIGTSKGVLSSTDGKTWALVDEFSGQSLVAGTGSEVFVLNGGALYRAVDLEDFAEIARDFSDVTAVTVTPQTVYLALGSDDLVAVSQDGRSTPVNVSEPPQEVLAFAAGEGDRPVMLAGGLSSGLWRSEDGGAHFTRILGTPIRAALVDRREKGRLMIGTAGGVLTSTPTRPWGFTDLRVAVEALAQTENAYLAVTADRLLYRSSDGETWEPTVPLRH